MMPEGWEPSAECRIGSLPWFAGMTWLTISWVLSVLGRLAFKAYCMRLAYVFVVLSNKACAQAAQCAFEGGARV